jgi:hypothetical protein
MFEKWLPCFGWGPYDDDNLPTSKFNPHVFP